MTYAIKIVQLPPNATLFYTEMKDGKVWGMDALKDCSTFETEAEVEAEMELIHNTKAGSSLLLGKVIID